MFDLLGCGCLAFFATGLMFLRRLRAPLGADEGYLWYGVQQLLRGRMPHRDFKSYEPGRYLWSAPFVWLAGGSLAGIRVATHVFAFVCLAVALHGLRRLGLEWSAVAAAAVVLAAWSHPQHKQFEYGWLLLGWTAISAWLQLPDSGSTAWVAAAVGFSLLFGFNLMLYLLAAAALAGTLALVLGWMSLQTTAVGAAFAGFAVGVLPFAAFLLSRGFRQMFWTRRIGSVLARGGANLAVPYPWPWRTPTNALSSMPGLLRRVSFQWWFVAMLLLPILVMLLLWIGLSGDLGWITPAESDGLLARAALSTAPGIEFGLLAAACVGIFAWHHAASRADPAHLTQASAPTLLLVLMISSYSIGFVAAMAAVLLWMIRPLAWPAPTWAAQQLAIDGAGRELPIAYSGEQRLIVSRIATLVSQSPEMPSAVFAAPAFPMVHALLHWNSPVYDTFCVHPADLESQRRMICEIEQSAARIAVVSDAAIDGREDLRFSRTHPEVWLYLQQNFQPRAVSGLPAHVQLLLRIGQG